MDPPKVVSLAHSAVISILEDADSQSLDYILRRIMPKLDMNKWVEEFQVEHLRRICQAEIDSGGRIAVGYSIPGYMFIGPNIHVTQLVTCCEVDLYWQGSRPREEFCISREAITRLYNELVLDPKEREYFRKYIPIVAP